MCGRYSLAVSPEELEQVFEAPVAGPITLPRWNIAPTQDAPVVCVSRTPSGELERRIVPLRWGLVPHWAEEPSVGTRHINARAETVETAPAYRDAFARRRCLVPADGFYEWTARGGRKLPWWIHHHRGGLLAFAGVRERWRARDGEGALHTFSILTTTPNAVVAPLHDRMPVVLEPRDWATWLDRSAPLDRVRALLAPAREDLLAVRPVSPLVNRVENDDARCVAAAPEPELLDLFEGG
jgi:putative SOS response-associated peptidase YedK